MDIDNTRLWPWTFLADSRHADGRWKMHATHRSYHGTIGKEIEKIWDLSRSPLAAECLRNQNRNTIKYTMARHSQENRQNDILTGWELLIAR